jgi:hypothetical protein
VSRSWGIRHFGVGGHLGSQLVGWDLAIERTKQTKEGIKVTNHIQEIVT